MDAISAILNRRSIRKFTGENISDEILDKILDCAIAAPSARGNQPWELIVIKNKNSFKAIMDIHPYAKMLDKAAVAILICGNMNIEAEMGYIALNCAAVTQNVLLAATAYNLGSVWLGIYPREERMNKIKELFKLPENIIPIAIAVIGVSDEIPKQANRIKEGKIRYETDIL